MKCRGTLFCLWLLLGGGVMAQNLVPNPGFEEISRCPQGFSTDRNDFIVPGWTSATRGTPDQFHACSWNEADVPYNWAGASNARTGRGYVGIYAWIERADNNHYREYVQCELAEPLKAGLRYRLEFFYKLSSYSVFAIDRMGMLLTAERLELSHDQVIDMVPTLSVKKDSSITSQTGGWEYAEMEFVAKGGEMYVTIGNFYNNQQTGYTKLPHRVGKSSMLAHSAYYYIDDVGVTLLDQVHEVNEVNYIDFDEERIELNKDYILKNIQFEFDSYTLLKSSFPELDLVVQYMSNHPLVKARLSGHTDFLGSEAYNVLLSQNRARSVAEYLILKGIKADRITSFGFGKSRPIALEKTDEARSINRRVEIRFVEPRTVDKF